MNEPLKLPGEEWRPIVGHEGFLSVSDFGRAKSEARTIRKGDFTTRLPEKIRTPNPRAYKGGYPTIGGTINGTPYRIAIHCAVAEAFIGPRPEGYDVCHNDGNPENNRLSNLRYGTRTENIMDAVHQNTHHWAKKEECPRGHPYEPCNLVKSNKKDGHRSCLACSRGRAHVRRHPDDNIDKICDMKFTELANSLSG